MHASYPEPAQMEDLEKPFLQLPSIVLPRTNCVHTDRLTLAGGRVNLHSVAPLKQPAPHNHGIQLVTHRFNELGFLGTNFWDDHTETSDRTAPILHESFLLRVVIISGVYTVNHVLDGVCTQQELSDVGLRLLRYKIQRQNAERLFDLNTDLFNACSATHTFEFVHLLAWRTF